MNPVAQKPAAELTHGKPSYHHFVWAAIAWALAGTAVTLFGAPREEAIRALEWFGIFYAVSVADLYSIARVVGCILELMGATEKRIPGLIQASYWGILKLACLGIFTVLVFKGHEIPVTALLMGVGTMVFVPLVGGYWWSKSLQ
jgi:hypothetical protein